MSQIERLLTRLEARLRQLVEGGGRVDGVPVKLHRLLEREVVHALKTNLRHLSPEGSAPGATYAAPDRYTLVLPAVDAQILMSHPAELDRLARRLEDVAAQTRAIFQTPPMLRAVADPHTVGLSISVGFSTPGLAESSTYPLEDLPFGSRNELIEPIPKAYLIVNGLSTFPILTPVVNIGRDPANQLQLSEPHISPQHAQLRLVQGRFFIFDLDSQRGTMVNGVPVSNHALNPGDVILLAGIPLVYGQETCGADGQTQELPVGPPPPEVL